MILIWLQEGHSDSDESYYSGLEDEDPTTEEDDGDDDDDDVNSYDYDIDKVAGWRVPSFYSLLEV